MTKVFIIDQQSLFRQGVRASLSHIPDIEVLGEANADEEVLSTIETSPPDVVLLGLNAAFLNSLKLCHMIKQRLPSVATIILTSQPGDGQLFQAIKAQASAYLSKDVDTNELARTIKRCAQG